MFPAPYLPSAPEELVIREYRHYYLKLTVWQICTLLAAWISLAGFPVFHGIFAATLTLVVFMLWIAWEKDRLRTRLTQLGIKPAKVVGIMDGNFWIWFFLTPLGFVGLVMMALARACSMHSCC